MHGDVSRYTRTTRLLIGLRERDYVGCLNVGPRLRSNPAPLLLAFALNKVFDHFVGHLRFLASLTKSRTKLSGTAALIASRTFCGTPTRSIGSIGCQDRTGFGGGGARPRLSLIRCTSAAKASKRFASSSSVIGFPVLCSRGRSPTKYLCLGADPTAPLVRGSPDRRSGKSFDLCLRRLCPR